MPGNRIGQVVHYYNHINVAVIMLTATIHVGDIVHILGHSTDFRQEVTSVQIEHQPVIEAGPGQEIALKVIQRVHPHDGIYKLTDENP